MNDKAFLVITILGILLYLVWGGVMDSFLKYEKPYIKDFKELNITYKPDQLVVILSHVKGSN